ncbi:hypothetical protein AMTRI_Chr09g33580 [Amborella trichopoda]|uniref:uncharacterized protein LOC18445435 n=1 Tax=Amborella trichopoda TaxID=13333 RepID=UPI0005D3E94B|nr:uncharacterized protein LOC18445435 [Amborella trichopoda]|eukprot:XP_011627506.1 uncharacterized protein LOC18445435 [Amborella trichopoda]
MAEKPDTQLFHLLTHLLQQVEAESNQEEVELRAKIEALGLEVRKVPSKPAEHIDELEIARELDNLSAKLDNVEEMISSAMAQDPQVGALLSNTADLWMPVITATSEERHSFSTEASEHT